jgi:hypothetical protein
MDGINAVSMTLFPSVCRGGWGPILSSCLLCVSIIPIMSSSITITVDELASALDNLGLTPTVSAELLYKALVQVQASRTPPSQPPKVSLRCKLNL